MKAIIDYYKSNRMVITGNLIIGLCLTYIFYSLTGFYSLKIALFLLAGVVFVLSFPHTKPLVRYLSLFMFIIGFYITIGKENGFIELVEGFTVNMPLLVLILLVPLISIPFKIGGYFDSIHHFLEKIIDQPKKMFGGISTFIFFFGPILNIGSVRVIHDLVRDLRLNSMLLAKAYIVGFSTVVLWSPYFASVALVLLHLDVPISKYIPLGLAFAILQLIIGNLLFWMWDRNGRLSDMSNFQSNVLQTDNVQHQASQNVSAISNLFKLFLTLFVLIGALLILEYFTIWSMLFLVSITAMLYPLIWGLFSRKWKGLYAHFKSYKENTSLNMNNEIVLFITAGLFGSALTGTTVANQIETFLIGVSGVSFLLFVITVISIVVSLTFIGIHPIVVVTVLATQMNPVELGTSPAILALMFMVSWSMSAVLSPVNPLNILVSNAVNKSGLIVGLKWNGTYMLAMFVMSSLCIYWLNIFMS